MKTYPKYKDSGVEWLGDVPEGWEVLPLKRAYAFFTGWTPPTGESHWYEGTNSWVNISDIKTKHINETQKHISDEAVKQHNMKPVPKGSLLFSFKLTLGKVSLSDRPLFTNEAIASFPPQEQVNLNYSYYSFPIAIPFNASVNIYGAPILNQGLIKSALIPLPPLPEQQTIAAFLDHEVAKIDELIREQERLIELLAEKRQATISHAVTKGLDPNAKLKPSGVEWLGDVPEDWEVVKLKYLLNESLKYGANESADDDNPNQPRFIRITDLNNDNTLRDDTFKSLPLSVAKDYLLEHNDILLARSGATVGKSFLYTMELGQACFAGYLIRARVKPSQCDPRWVKLFTESHQYWQFISQTNIQSTIQNVSAERYANLSLPVPPLWEQGKLSATIENRNNKLDTLTATAREAIALLQERRSALISAAVTGKIDVRDFVAPALKEA